MLNNGEMYTYTAEEINAAFITPLRSAMLIDDRFPRYLELVDSLNMESKKESLGTASYDWDSLRDLFTQCKNRGLTCDVENRTEPTAEESLFEKIRHVGASDLVVLDYHLTPGDDQDSQRAHLILQHLADSAHANLVVVYTAATDLDKVKRGIAAYFRGIRKDRCRDDDYVLFSTTGDIELSSTVIEGFITSGVTGIPRAERQQLMTTLKEKGVDGPNLSEYLRTVIEDEILTKLGAREVEGDPFTDGAAPVQFSAGAAAQIWVAHKNAFVVIVNKRQDKNIFSELEKALCDWNPSPLRLLLVHARNYLEQRGFLSDWTVLQDDSRQKAWVYHLLSGEEPSNELRLEQLFDRVFEGIWEDLTASIVSISKNLLSPTFAESALKTGEREGTLAVENRRLEIAQRLTRSSTAINRIDIFHDLNSFLSTDEFRGTHLRAGTVFTCKEDDKYWVCATADCGLIHREPHDKKTWEAELFPYLPLLALRLEEEIGKSQEHALQSATNGRHLFLRLPERRIVLRIAHEESRQLRPEMFIITKMNLSQKPPLFNACRIDKRASNEAKELGPRAEMPSLKEYKFEVIAQLRNSYADRLLTQTGHHSARIGVDFLSCAKT